MILLNVQCAHKVENRSKNSSYSISRPGLRTVYVLLLLSFILSSCEPVAAGIKANVGVGVGIVIATILTSRVWGALRVKNKVS